MIGAKRGGAVSTRMHLHHCGARHGRQGQVRDLQLRVPALLGYMHS